MTGKQITRIAPSFVGAAEVYGRRTLPAFFVSMTGFSNPGIIGRFDVDRFDSTSSLDSAWSIYRTTRITGLKAEEFDAEQVWYESKDGTRVPMFLVRHTSTKRDGTAPAIQYGKLSCYHVAYVIIN
jgi:prolyl oligopeptidase